jgi:hypothetical protein
LKPAVNGECEDNGARVGRAAETEDARDRVDADAGDEEENKRGKEREPVSTGGVCGGRPKGGDGGSRGAALACASSGASEANLGTAAEWAAACKADARSSG